MGLVILVGTVGVKAGVVAFIAVLGSGEKGVGILVEWLSLYLCRGRRGVDNAMSWASVPVLGGVRRGST